MSTALARPIRSALFVGSMAILCNPLEGCSFDPESTDWNARIQTPTPPEATPPPSESPSEEALYELLFAGEFGQPAHHAGQRARMIVWLRAMNLRAVQLVELEGLAQTVASALEQERRTLSELGTREQAYLDPVYRELVTLLATEARPSKAQLDAVTTQLSAAREAAYGGLDPRTAQVERVQTILDAARAWVESLSHNQRSTLTQSRFFLRRKVGALVNPGDHETLMTTRWNAGDYQLVEQSRSGAKGGLDIGGLWEAEQMRTRPGDYFSTLQACALVVLALQEPGLTEAIDVLQGEAPPLAGLDTPRDSTSSDPGSTEVPVESSLQPVP
ncbi:MAG: hypothetical protein QGG40_08665 [Myxococcota bacterium]|nr:hypothetical protein [Myxococcota bacterium]